MLRLKNIVPPCPNPEKYHMPHDAFKYRLKPRIAMTYLAIAFYSQDQVPLTGEIPPMKWLIEFTGLSRPTLRKYIRKFVDLGILIEGEEDYEQINNR